MFNPTISMFNSDWPRVSCLWSLISYPWTCLVIHCTASVFFCQNSLWLAVCLVFKSSMCSILTPEHVQFYHLSVSLSKVTLISWVPSVLKELNVFQITPEHVQIESTLPSLCFSVRHSFWFAECVVFKSSMCSMLTSEQVQSYHDFCVSLSDIHSD